MALSNAEKEIGERSYRKGSDGKWQRSAVQLSGTEMG